MESITSAYLLCTIGRLILSVGPSSPPTTLNSAGRMTTCTIVQKKYSNNDNNSQK